MRQISDKAPFFIVGCPRSGTTLLQLLVESQPNIAIPPESHIFERFSDIFHCYGDFSKSANLRLFVHDLLRDYHIRDWELGVTADEFCSQLQERSIRGILSLLMAKYASKEGACRWGEKTPQHLLYASQITDVFPRAKFIHIIRDGRDVAVSSKRVTVGPPSAYGVAKEWKRYILTFNEFKTELDPDRWIEVRYEDIVRNTNAELARIFRFLGETPVQVGADVPTSFAKEFYVHDDVHMLSLKQPISTAKIGAYKKGLTTRELEVFEHVAGDGLQAYGYPLVTGQRVAVTITPSERLRYLMADKFYRYFRKYFRLREPGKAWFLMKREMQSYFRKCVRCLAAHQRIRVIAAHACPVWQISMETLC
jgi:Sulfotransferase family